MLKKQPKQGAIDRAAEAHAKSGLHSLFMMVIGALVAVMVGVFIYLSPFFDEKTLDVNGQEAKVVPLPEKNDQMKYEFYEVLPSQDFHSVPEGLSEPNDELSVGELTVDAVVEDNSPKADDKSVDDEIVVVEELGTYDDMADMDDKPANVKISAGDVTYILQVYTYVNADEADRRRAEVIMAGVNAEVVRREIGEDDVIYQVVSEPMASRELALRAYERLKRNGIDAVVVEQRH